MAMKITRTHGVQVLLERCGCKVRRDYEDPQCQKPLSDTSFIPCPKHKGKKESSETIELILSELLDKEVQEATRNSIPAPEAPAANLRSVQSVAANSEADSGIVTGPAGAMTRTPIVKKPGAAARTMVRRAGDGGLPAVSSAVAVSRAAGSAASIDAELARAPEPKTGARILPSGTTKGQIQEVIAEAAEVGDEPITPLDVILGAADETDHSRG
jgi:hypothetical protein